jgi:hypothetical protein
MKAWRIYLAIAVLSSVVITTGWLLSPFRSGIADARDRVETFRRLQLADFESLVDISRSFCGSCPKGEVLQFGFVEQRPVPPALKSFRFERVIVTHDMLEGRVAFMFDSGVFARVDAKAGKVVLVSGDTSEIEEILYEKKAAEPGATDNPDDAHRLREDH